MAMLKGNKVVWTGAIAAVTAVGAVVGAQLKGGEEVTQVCSKYSIWNSPKENAVDPASRKLET